MSSVKLAKIPALTFYAGAKTKARRTRPIDQLKCIGGKACSYYRPEAVRCTNIGGEGVDVDWKCEADLPENLRFGRVEVSCEGWSHAGDPMVLKGSCGLEYRLVEIPREGEDSILPTALRNLELMDIIFGLLYCAILCVILYSFFKSCLGPQPRNSTPRAPPPRPWYSGGLSSDNSDNYGTGSGYPPPPYTKSATPGADTASWRPGFWTGAAVGGLANQLWNQRRRDEPLRQNYDWERTGPRPTSFASGLFRSRDSASSTSNDRGEGSSSGASVRPSTVFASSHVR